MSALVGLDLILGSSERYIVEQGEGAEAMYAHLPAVKGVQRSVVFHDCKVRSSDVDLRNETFDVWITEQSPDNCPYSDAPWKLGAITTTRTRHESPLLANLYVLPMAFQQFWEIADTPETEGVVQIQAHRESTVLFVFRLSLEARPRRHPVVVATDRRWRELAQIARMAVIGLVAGAVAISLINWIVSHRP